MSKEKLLQRREHINQLHFAIEAYIHRWRDMALIGLGEEAQKTLRDIRKITFDCEKIDD